MTVETLTFDQPNVYIKENGLAALPEFQRCGIGKILMERIEKLAGERKALLIGFASDFQLTDAHVFYAFADGGAVGGMDRPQIDTTVFIRRVNL